MTPAGPYRTAVERPPHRCGSWELYSDGPPQSGTLRWRCVDCGLHPGFWQWVRL